MEFKEVVVCSKKKEETDTEFMEVLLKLEKIKMEKAEKERKKHEEKVRKLQELGKYESAVAEIRKFKLKKERQDQLSIKLYQLKNHRECGA